jgi:hypothetical protein
MNRAYRLVGAGERAGAPGGHLVAHCAGDLLPRALRHFSLKALTTAGSFLLVHFLFSPRWPKGS